MPATTIDQAPWHPSIDIAAWERAATDPAVIIADGSHLRVTVRNGHLSVDDGPPGAPRNRKLSRIHREVSRLVILAGHGYVTIEAERWLKMAGISWVILDTYDGDSVVASSAPQPQDARLLRSQARAIDGGENEHAGLEITKYLLGVKLRGQAAITEEFFSAPAVAGFIRARASDVSKCETIAKCGIYEGLAAESYWHAWDGNVHVPFGAADASKVPAHWKVFIQRASLVNEVMRNRNASDPVNACLNFIYRVAETECVHACHAAGLSPILGISHTDKPNRDSLALDLLESVRPYCDRVILEMLRTGERFDRRWLHETRDGAVRLAPPLTHRLASHAAGIAAELAPHAHKAAVSLASASTGIVTVKRPRYKDRTPRATRHVGYPAARLAAGIGAAQLVPDAVWAEIEPILPPHPPMGRPYGCSDRDMVATLAARYVLRVPWGQALMGAVHRSSVNDRLRRWEACGAWGQIRQIMEASGHLQKLTL